MSDAAVTGDAPRAARLGAGWFGKVPALGDFVARRLPPATRDRFDAWLSAGMVEGERRLGAAWPQRYLAFPVWRFVATDPADASPCWAGVLAPGADRVGRLYPVLVAGAVPLEPDAAPTLDALDAALSRIEDALIGLLEDDDVGRFDDVLLGLGAGDDVDAPASGDGPGPALADRVALHWLRAAAAPAALFWRVDADGAPVVEARVGPLDAATFVRLAAGPQEDAHG